jgi:hypothetical protein
MEFYRDWWVRERVEYPEWKARKVVGVELTCGYRYTEESEQ